MLCISKILKNESNSQLPVLLVCAALGCCVSQRYWKMKAIHNAPERLEMMLKVVVYLKDTEKWKQFTTMLLSEAKERELLCISKILKNESNSQPHSHRRWLASSCCVSQRYWKMKAIHNWKYFTNCSSTVVVYLKDTEKWKQFTTSAVLEDISNALLCISKILKNESNSQQKKRKWV